MIGFRHISTGREPMKRFCSILIMAQGPGVVKVILQRTPTNTPTDASPPVCDPPALAGLETGHYGNLPQNPRFDRASL